MEKIELSVLPNLRIRKITGKDLYKIYNVQTKEIVAEYETRKQAFDVLNSMTENKKKEVKINEDANTVIVHVKPGENVKDKVKEVIKNE